MSNDDNQASNSFESDVQIAEQQIAHSQYLKDQDAIELIDHENYLISEALIIIEKRAKKYGETLNDVKTAAMYFMLDLFELEKEVFKVAFLNTKHQLIQTETVAIGTINSATVHIREIAKLVLQHNASSIILAHNHPSGNTSPSMSDIRFTERVIESLALFDVRVIDHFVIANHNYHSMCANNNLEFSIKNTGSQ